MSERRPHILLVEDDAELGAGLRDALDMEGYRLRQALDGRVGLKEALTGEYALVILDVMLPRLSGFDLLRELRRARPDQAVIMLTARGQEIDKIRGLKLGADDYVTKPFSVAELAARVATVLRRARTRPTLIERLELQGVVVDFRAREAWAGAESIELTPREFEILRALAARRGEAVSREDLLGVIWGLRDDVDVSTRTIDQHIVALRRKLGDNAASPRIIETVYGHGYRLAGLAVAS